MAVDSSRVDKQHSIYYDTNSPKVVGTPTKSNGTISGSNHFFKHPPKLSHYLDPANLGDIIARIGCGLSFGEKAIMEEGGRRMASIFASQDTETLV